MKRGLLIDDSNRIPFTFEGRHMTCFSGDTIASALWRNNIKILSRSFKYHRPQRYFIAGRLRCQHLSG